MSFNIAAICTMYYPLSHADVIVTRWLEPHRNDAYEGFVPTTQIASLYVAQMPVGDPPPDTGFVVSPNARNPVTYDPRFDISHAVAATYGVPQFATVREALTLGGDALAVDGVLLIGEHGDYPQNEYDQKLYPRKELFDEIVAVFRASGRSVPVFVDKHLSWNMDWARAMVATAHELGFALMAGSSIPLAGPMHDLELPAAPDIRSSLGLFYVHPEVYGFHSLEFVQSVIEQRIGGEPGVRSLCVWQGEDVWAALDAGAIPQDLYAAALAAAIHVQPGDARTNCRQSGVPPFAARLDHVDGHVSYHMLLHGHIQDFVVALRLRDDPRIRVSSVDFSMDETFVRTFAILDREIQRLFTTNISPVPLARTLFTTLATATWMHALRQSGTTIATPHLVL